MAIGVSLAYIKHTFGSEKPTDTEDKHRVAKTVGKTVTAALVVLALVAVYGLSIAGIMGMGPFATGMGSFAGFSFQANIAILSVVGGIDFLTILGMGLRKCGFGAPKPAEA